MFRIGSGRNVQFELNIQFGNGIKWHLANSLVDSELPEMILNRISLD